MGTARTGRVLDSGQIQFYCLDCGPCLDVGIFCMLQWVRDIKVEKLALCGAGWQPARRLATAAVWCKRGRWPIDNRPQLTKLPHNGTCALRTTYAQIPPVLLMNCAGLHFLVAHPASVLTGRS